MSKSNDVDPWGRIRANHEDLEQIADRDDRLGALASITLALGQLGGGAPAGDPPTLDRNAATTAGTGTGDSLYLSASETLTYEIAIEWEAGIRPLEYVREASVPTSTWRDPVPAPRGAARRVGYAVHTPPRSAGGTLPELVGERRVFYLMPHDRAMAPDDVYAAGAPVEAVDPRTVFPGVAGVMTDRARGQDGRAPVQGGEPA